MKPRDARQILSLKDAVRLKSAELWLRLGEPMLALSELQYLPPESREHPDAIEICRSVYQAALEG